MTSGGMQHGMQLHSQMASSWENKTVIVAVHNGCCSLVMHLEQLIITTDFKSQNIIFGISKVTSTS